MINLKELGLTMYESKVYEILIKFQKAKAATISRDSGVPYSRIYDVLSSLHHKGFVKILPGKVKEYAPAEPQELLKIAEKKKEGLTKTIEEIKQMKKLYDNKIKEPVILGHGKENFFVLTSEMEEATKYTYSIRYNADPKPRWVQFQNKYQKTGIEVKDMTRYDEESKKNVDTWLTKTKTPWKQIHNEGIAMNLHDDKEIMISLIKSNCTLLIRDEAFVKLMKQLYLAQWEQAKALNKAAGKI